MVVLCDIYCYWFVLQKELKETQMKFQQRQKDLQQLREAVVSHKVSLEKKRSLRSLSLVLFSSAGALSVSLKLTVWLCCV